MKKFLNNFEINEFNSSFVIIIIILSFLFFPACQNKKASGKNNLIEKRNGLIYKQKSDTAFTGIIKDTIKNKIFEYHVKQGLNDGEFKISELNGQTIMIGNMVKDKNEGEWKYFYPNGQIESIGNFTHDQPNGKWIFYFETGMKKEEGIFVNGVRTGKWIEYDSAGAIKDYKNFTKEKEIK